MKIGLEIHQRLATHKLFCACPSEMAEENAPSSIINRRLHPVLSELGEIDAASKAEHGKAKNFVYQLSARSNCLVEMDEEPPHPVNPDALSITLEIASQLGAKPVDEMHFMRKIVIDGSNTSGFQRTAIVALDGKLETTKGTVPIPLIALEEESAGIVEGTETQAVYRLDRLGIPLIEISTSPDIKDGVHLLEVAQKLGMILRASGKVARGLGTIRQDVNISTERGARVEIKGAQELKLLPLFVANEVRRQEELLKLMDERSKLFGGKAGIVAALRNAEPTDLTDVFLSTSSPMISKGISSGSRVFGIAIAHHDSLLGRELSPGRRFGTELSDYAKQAGVKGIIHSDEGMLKYGISDGEVIALQQKLGMAKDSAFVLVVAPEPQAKAALGFVVARAQMDYVPEETRRANPDGTSSYMRPLPGRARMYPETDVPPVRITKEMLSSISKAESLEDKQKKLRGMLNPELAETMLRSRNLPLFEKLVEQGADPMLAATTLENTLVSLRREGVAVESLDTVLPELFDLYKKGLFVKSAIPDILKETAKGIPVQEAAKSYSLIRGSELKLVVETLGYDMKAIMSKYRTRVDPQELQKMLKHKKD